LVQSIQVIYGNVAPPTQFEKEGGFTPEGVQLEGSGAGDSAAQQTTVDAPQERPAGVSLDELYFNQTPADVTGTVFFPLLPEETESRFF
jgi:hypothetical protein